MSRTAWLVVNEFLQLNKFNEIHEWLRIAADKLSIKLILKTNAELLIDLRSKDLHKKAGDSSFSLEIGKELDRVEAQKVNVVHGKGDTGDPDFVLFWDKDTRLARHLEQLGYPVFNSSDAIAVCDDKSLTHLALMNEDIPMPRTIIAPKTFDNIGYTNANFLKEVTDRLGFPLVVKECFGSFGQQVYLVKESEELRTLVANIGTKPMLYQEFVSYSAGRDVRLQVVGGKVIASMYRYSENGDFRANLSIGGKMLPYEPSAEQCEMAVRCCEILGLDYAGVDLLFGKNGETLVCEVNSNAHFKNIYDCTGVNAADAILVHIINKLEAYIQDKRYASLE